MKTPRTAQVTTGSVVSRDGTPIGYLKIGQGPAVVLLHGSMESAHSHLLLAEELADQFTVYLPDRRGRGMSGPHRADHGIRTEVEDLEAVLTESGARMAFGVSASGLVILEAARTLPVMHKAAVYEPALLMEEATRHTAWLSRFDEEMAQGKVAKAMITSMLGLELGPPVMNFLPRWLLAAMTGMGMRSEERKAAPDAVTLRKLAPTLHYEGALLAEMAGRIDTFRTVAADVLVLGGSNGLSFLKPALEALTRTIPHCRRVEFPGLDHGSSSDPSTTNPAGSAERIAVVAQEVRAFFAGEAAWVRPAEGAGGDADALAHG